MLTTTDCRVSGPNGYTHHTTPAAKAQGASLGKEGGKIVRSVKQVQSTNVVTGKIQMSPFHL